MTKPRGEPQQRPGAGIWAPNLENLENYPIRVVLLGQGRIMGRQALDERGRLAEFALEAQVRSKSGTWLKMIRVDTKHDEVHAHYFSKVDEESVTERKREVWFPIRDYADVDRGYVQADDLITNEWDENRQRWEGGR